MACVERVVITADAYAVCLTHALSTEREEVMGLLLGEISVFVHHKPRKEMKEMNTRMMMMVMVMVMMKRGNE